MRDGACRPSLINQIIPFLLFDQNKSACSCRKLQALTVLKIDATYTNLNFFQVKIGALAGSMMVVETIALKMEGSMIKSCQVSLQLG
jgi:hypothetical protein